MMLHPFGRALNALVIPSINLCVISLDKTHHTVRIRRTLNGKCRGERSLRDEPKRPTATKETRRTVVEVHLATPA